MHIKCSDTRCLDIKSVFQVTLVTNGIFISLHSLVFLDMIGIEPRSKSNSLDYLEAIQTFHSNFRKF